MFYTDRYESIGFAFKLGSIVLISKELVAVLAYPHVLYLYDTKQVSGYTLA